MATAILKDGFPDVNYPLRAAVPWGASQSLRVTPAMQAGIADHVWSLEEIAGLVPEPVAKKRGPYKKRPDQDSN